MKLLLASLIGLVSLLVFIEYLHYKAHKTYELDVHGHVKQYCRIHDCSDL